MKIVASFDDASTSDVKIAELLRKYDLVENTTFYFPVMPTMVNEPKGRKSLTNSEADKIAADFEIGSHTITHPLLTRISLKEAKREILESRDILQKRYGQPVKKFCYPRGYANADVEALVADAGYESARSTLVGYIDIPENPFFQQTTVHVGYDRKEYGGFTWIEYARHMLSICEENSIFHFWGHGFEIATYPDGMYLFEQFLRELTEVRSA